MSLGKLTGTPGPNVPGIAPMVKLPGANNASAMTKSNTYTPNNYKPIPMPQSVANNPNLGWNSQTGKIIQPLTQQQQSQVAIAPYSPNIQIPKNTVFPGRLGGW